MTYQATAYQTQKPPVPGEVTVSDAGVLFEAPGITYRLPLADLTCRVGGVKNEIAYLSHPDQPGLEIVCPDLSLLEQPALSELESVRQALAVGRGYGRRLWGCGLSTLVLGALGLLLILLLLASLIGGIMHI